MHMASTRALRSSNRLPSNSECQRSHDHACIQASVPCGRSIDTNNNVIVPSPISTSSASTLARSTLAITAWFTTTLLQCHRGTRNSY